MKYINKKLTVEGKRLETIGKKYGTPTYCYSYKKLRENISNLSIKNIIVSQQYHIITIFKRKNETNR